MLRHERSASHRHLRHYSNFTGKDYSPALIAYIFGQLDSINESNNRARACWEIDRYWLQERSLKTVRTLNYISLCLRAAAIQSPRLCMRGDVRLGKEQPSFVEGVTETVKR